jgi:flavin-dependent thymidylate synthase
MKVSLIDYTGSGHSDPADYAASLLVFTKSTRLEMSPGLFSDILAWPTEKKLKELEYMANTIPSSWEMCDYTFMIEGVTRAFTHQFVRTRTASYAQQTMRVLDVSEGPGWDYLTGPSIPEKGFEGDACGKSTFDPKVARGHLYHNIMSVIAAGYKHLIKDGATIEDARGILPTNIKTNIVAKMNMRTFVEMARKRSSPRTQGEYRDVLEAMKEQVRAVHPWIGLFIDRGFDNVSQEFYDEILASELPQEKKTKLIKYIDQLRALAG